MSSHADTIRDYVTNIERYDGQWHRLPTDDETLAALDALLAENQRLREALELIVELESISVYDEDEGDSFAALDSDDVWRIAREALAGDTK